MSSPCTKEGRLLLVGSENREFNPVLFIHLAAGVDVEVGKRKLAGCLPAKNPQRFTQDGVVAHFHLAAVVEDEDGGGEIVTGGGPGLRQSLAGAFIARRPDGLLLVLRESLLLAK